MIKKTLILIIAAYLGVFNSMAALNSPENCQGSLRPYPVPKIIYTYPDSLTPIFINHVGRHGSRYPAGDSFCRSMKYCLNKADSLGTITPLGRKFLSVVNNVISISNGRWGALDSLGMAEQRGIAQRMIEKYSDLFRNKNIDALSSSSPRVIMSMYSFNHEIATKSSSNNINASSGPRFSYLMRPFDMDKSYLSFMAKAEWKKPYTDFLISNCPLNAIKNLLGEKYPASQDELRTQAMNEYYIIAGMSAMGLNIDYKDYLTLKEYNQLWSIFNLRQYLQHNASTVSPSPADIAVPLVENLVTVADSVISGKLNISAQLRFGHAETLMPLLSLIKLQNCYYLTHYFDTVQDNWKDYDVVPMAANIQFIFFRSKTNKIYVRTDLNEKPIPLIPGHNNLYLPWEQVREYLLSFTQYML